MTIMKHSKYVKLKDGYTEWASWILDYEEYNYPDDCKKVIQLICDNLEVKMCPTQYRELNKKNKLFGHCYHSTQALWYFFRIIFAFEVSLYCSITFAELSMLPSSTTIISRLQ